VVLLALSSFPILFICISSGNKKLIYWMHFFPCYVAKLVLFLWGIRLNVHGLEKFDHHRQYVFVGNHRSYLDAIISGAIIPNYKKYIGKAEVLSWPVLGYLLRKLYIPVQRDNVDSRKWSMAQLFEKTKSGASMVIYPEATCNSSSGFLLPFKEGAFRLSAGANIPIVVFTCIDAAQLWDRKTLYIIKPGTLTIHFSDPIYPANQEESEVVVLKEKTKREMLVYLTRYFPEGHYRD
jgi:1-acyl-sn-glycerol-3-phosphate acyltransferase